ncbi:NACHT, LRR and PYD domains-containing protein 12-like [Athene noctua]|uniref:NACHT, LRR and PYD domains-containing protein 12-like n=1 Tax=Athene noctua TaxID=126797 RepID=UPI003EBDC622
MGLRGSKESVPSSSSPQGTAGDLLLQALEDLSKINFKKFRHALAYGDLQGRNHIPWGRLEKADWIDTTNLMMNSYSGEDALDVAIIVFKHIQLREAAYQLQEKREKGGKAKQLPVCKCVKRPPTLPDYQRDYKKAICQEYSHIKDQNARVGDSVSLESRYSKLVIVNKHRDEEEREHEIMAMGQRHAEIMKEQASSSITVDDLFDPGPDVWTPKVVVLVGAAGMGKTMTARKIMLDWASDKVFAKFDYVFYIHCREGNLFTREASMAELITQCCPSGSLPLDKVLEQPEKLLFVIDGFDELRFSFHLPEPELCSQPKEKSLVEITLSSLFRRRFLPESSLLITTRPAALQKLSRFLKCERYAEIVGFSEVERKEYFYKFFNNAEQAAAVFQFVRGNEALLSTCLLQVRSVLGCCNLTAAGCRDLTAVLGAMPSLAQLDLSDNPVEDSGVRMLCRALAGPGCGTQKLWLWQCRLTEGSCGALAEVLPICPILRELHLGVNELGDGGVWQLSEGLWDPACRLQTLRLWQCQLTEESCRALAAVLPVCPSLREMHLGDNELGDGGVRWLSEGLRDPACRLQTLSLWKCQLTGACCKDLCAALSTSRSLEHLDLSENDLGDGGVWLLCESLGHPTCALQRLWLKKSGLNEETLQKLGALKEINPKLYIGYI